MSSKRVASHLAWAERTRCPNCKRKAAFVVYGARRACRHCGHSEPLGTAGIEPANTDASPGRSPVH